jgi:hypothetical protein
MGADASTFLAEYVVTQKWADALMRHPAKLDGFYYGSRLDSGTRCLAVFGRPNLHAAPARLRARANGALLEDLEFLAFLARCGVSLI